MAHPKINWTKQSGDRRGLSALSVRHFTPLLTALQCYLVIQIKSQSPYHSALGPTWSTHPPFPFELISYFSSLRSPCLLWPHSPPPHSLNLTRMHLRAFALLLSSAWMLFPQTAVQLTPSAPSELCPNIIFSMRTTMLLLSQITTSSRPLCPQHFHPSHPALLFLFPLSYYIVFLFNYVYCILSAPLPTLLPECKLSKDRSACDLVDVVS